MKSRSVSPDFNTADTPMTYRVRLWSAPPRQSYAWAIDDWEIEDIESAADVFAWAERQADGRPYEVFVRTVGVEPWLRIHGAPADDSEQKIEVLLVAEAPAQ